MEKQKSTLVPDKKLSGNLFNHRNDSRERLHDTDDESDSYSQFAMITERNKKQKAHQQQHIHFGFGNNNKYTNNSVTPIFRDHRIATTSINENQSTKVTEENFNKLFENMENRFYRMSQNLQRKHEAQLNEAYDQIQQTIIEFSTQQNQRNETNEQHRPRTELNASRPPPSERTNITDNRPQRTENTEIQNNSVMELHLPFYKQLNSMSIKEKTQTAVSSSNGSVPTTLKRFDGTDQGYTVEEYLNSKDFQ